MASAIASARSASRVTALRERLGELDGLLAALQQGHAGKREGTGRNGRWVDHRGKLSAERLGGRREATEHVLQLAALLQEDRQRSLAALQGDDDVGDLSRRTTERGGLLGGADAVLVQFGAGLLRRGLAGRQLLHDLVQDRATGAQ